MKMRWLGQAGYELTDGHHSVLIDPYLSDMVYRVDGFHRLIPPPFTPQEIKADIIIYTHDHVDHLDEDTVMAVGQNETCFAGPESGRAVLRRCNVAEEYYIPLNRGGVLDFAGMHIEAVFAEHTADSIGLLCTYAERKYYFTGDTLLTPEVGKGIQADVIFVCINGKLGNMNVSEAAELTRRVGAAVGVPNHYGMFAENTEDPQKYVEALENTSCTAFVMEYNREYELSELGN